MYMYLNKRHEPMIAGLENALRRMKQDGSYQTIVSRFLAPFKKEMRPDDK